MDRHRPHQVAEPPCILSRRAALRRTMAAATVALVASAAPYLTATAASDPLTGGSDLLPRPGMAAILQAMDRFPLVGIAALDPLQELYAFLTALLFQPGLPGRVSDIVVEFGKHRCVRAKT